MLDIHVLKKKILARNRRALAKAITLFESKRKADQKKADELSSLLLSAPGESLRIGISGPPGVGKSTLIEALGNECLADHQLSLAILAIDPTSPISGGSILGDRTRMETLSRNERVFIRPSPSGSTLGGVGRHTREAIISCEKAGYNLIFVETVGVGQSEFIVSSMVDLFIILHQPYSGDDLQGMKRGILELADLILITKADGPLLTGAKLAKHQLEQALRITSSKKDSTIPVILTSAAERIGLAEAKSAIFDLIKLQKISGKFEQKRGFQAKQWLFNELNAQILEAINDHKVLSETLKNLENEVISKKISGSAAARQIIKKFFTQEIK